MIGVAGFAGFVFLNGLEIGGVVLKGVENNRVVRTFVEQREREEMW